MNGLCSRLICLCVLFSPLSALHAQGQAPVPSAVSENERAATAVLERYIEVQGVNRPDSERYPKRLMLDLRAGDPVQVTHITFETDGKGYWLMTKTPDGKFTFEISEGLRPWMVSDVLGSGPLKTPSLTAKSLLRGRDNLARLRQEYTGWQRRPNVTRAGKELEVVAMSRRDGGELWFFESKTGVLVLITPPSGATDAESGAVGFGDFRTVDGVLEPFELVVGSGAKRVVQKTLRLENRAKIAPDRFKAPATSLKLWNSTEELLKRYLRSCGGAPALAQIVSRRMTMKSENTTMGVITTQTLWQKLPNWVVIETDQPGVGKSWQGFHGDKGWSVSELEGERAIRGEELRGFVQTWDLHNMDNFAEKHPWRRVRGEKEINGRRTMGLELAGPGGRAGTHYFEAGTGRLVRMETMWTMEGEGGSLPVTIDFSDFRTVDNVTLPFEMVITNPAVRIVTKIESVEHNIEIDDAVFQPRKIE